MAMVVASLINVVYLLGAGHYIWWETVQKEKEECNSLKLRFQNTDPNPQNDDGGLGQGQEGDHLQRLGGERKGEMFRQRIQKRVQQGNANSRPEKVAGLGYLFLI